MVEKTPWLEQRLQVTFEPSFGSFEGQMSDTERKFMNSSMVAPILKTDAKSGSIDGGFVASIIGGGVDVYCCGRGVKDGNDCGMTVEYTGEESVITKTGIVRSVEVCLLGTS
ncbi:hypothetical protein Tco_1117331 [Tanacetum coccineum]